MGAALGNQYRITVLQLVKLSGPEHSCLQITLVACKEDGEGGERYICRSICVYFLEGLGIGDDQGRFLSKSPQGLRQFGFSGDYRDSAGFQHIADGLLLGQDQTPFWCRGVNRDYQYHHILRLDQVCHDTFFIGFCGCSLGQCADSFLQFVDLISTFRADIDRIILFLLLFRPGRHSGKQVRFVVHGNMWNFLFCKKC